METAYHPTPRTTPTRYRERARYDHATVHRILDEALVCHLGYVSDGRPVVLPTTHARLDDVLYMHGSSGSGPMLAARLSGMPVCVTVTLIDGLVLARSAMHHSLNYRSVVAVGTARIVDDPDEKRRALHALLDHIRPGRADHCRPPNARELAATSVLPPRPRRSVGQGSGRGCGRRPGGPGLAALGGSGAADRGGRNTGAGRRSRSRYPAAVVPLLVPASARCCTATRRNPGTYEDARGKALPRYSSR